MDKQSDSNDQSELLSEFCQALEDEIKAIKKKASSSGVSLSNGKRIDTKAGQYQYLFSIEDTLNYPEDSPLQFVLPGKIPMEVTIISVEDIHITISIKEDLGDFISSATLQSDLSILLKKLIDRIESNSNTENTAALRMLGIVPVYGIEEPMDKLALSSNENLTQDQIKAVKSAVGRNMTYIWGPPGTGKTTVIGTIIYELYRRNRSVLLVSYTNIAVDEAIIKTIGKIDKTDIDDGYIIRMGIPKNEKLSKDYPQVLLEEQKKRYSEELQLKLNNKEYQLEILTEDIQKCEREIFEYNWYINYESSREKLNFVVNEYKLKFGEEERILKEIRDLEEKEKTIAVQIDMAKEYISLMEKHSKYLEILNNEAIIRNSINEEIIRLENSLDKNNKEIILFNRRLEIEKELSNYISIESQNLILEKLTSEINNFQSQMSAKICDVDILKEKLTKAINTSKIMRTIKRISAPEKISDDIAIIQVEIDRLKEKLKSKNTEYDKVYNTYKNTCNLQRELEKLPKASLKNLKKQNSVISENIKRQYNTIKEFDETIIKANEEIIKLEEKMRKLEDRLEYKAEIIVSNYNEFKDKLGKKVKEYKYLKKQINNIVETIKNITKDIKRLPNEVDLHFSYTEIYKTLKGFENYYNSLVEKFFDFNIDEHKNIINMLKNNLKEVNCEIKQIKEKLAEIEKEIILQAKIIGTTLTKAYLSNELQERKFDTVILDEASMAPIPALWATTLMSSNNVIIVGDFKQLPPIVLSNTELAKKWIGCDIFEQSGVKEKYEKKCPPDNFIILREQYRMEKSIADIANRYYDGKLQTPRLNGRIEKKKKFEEWYNNVVGTDSSVVLVDTASLNAWVTSVSKGNQTSRLNFFSATLSVNLAERIISKYKSSDLQVIEDKVLIISPYRPHTKLTDELIKESGIDGIVRAGTVHSFQGSEAEVVIFDLVVDEPHFRVNLFMHSEEIDEQMRRLFNVSVTRAKFKLFIIGNFKYCMSKGKNSELGKLLEYLINERKFPIVDAKELTPKLYENTLKAQKSVIGGTIGTKEERLLVNQEQFYKYFCHDLEQAKERVIIYSPFITKNRLSYLLPQLQAAIERKVAVYVVTKSLQERNKGEVETYKDIEEHISKIGVNIIHKKGMHEKVVFIDKEILWSGSLNPLSFSSTQEVMERRKSKSIVESYMKVLYTTELIECINRPEARCPICNSEMIAAEGKDEPYFWRCVNDNCFTRGIKQKYPTNGELSCSSCGGALEFGYWGKEPCWRCIENKRHHQKLYKSQLKLPKVMNKIPKEELKNVSQYLGISSLDKQEKQNTKEVKRYEQMNLFED